MPFFNYRQNNTGGSFDIDIASGLTVEVIIEARDAYDANSRAESLGIYFDGVGDMEVDDDGDEYYTGRDCSCCGDRWYPADNSEGTEKPEHYGEPLVDEFQAGEREIRWTDDNKPMIIVHYLDGRIVGFDPHTIINPGQLIIHEVPL
jgi:hypothetical protein